MWDDHNEREMRAQQAAEANVDQLFEQLETTLDEIAQAEADFRIYEQGERDPI